MWTLIVVILGASSAGGSGTTSFVVPNFKTEQACAATGGVFVRRIGEARYTTYHCAKVAQA